MQVRSSTLPGPSSSVTTYRKIDNVSIEDKDETSQTLPDQSSLRKGAAHRLPTDDWNLYRQKQASLATCCISTHGQQALCVLPSSQDGFSTYDRERMKEMTLCATLSDGSACPAVWAGPLYLVPENHSDHLTGSQPIARHRKPLRLSYWVRMNEKTQMQRQGSTCWTMTWSQNLFLNTGSARTCC